MRKRSDGWWWWQWYWKTMRQCERMERVSFFIKIKYLPIHICMDNKENVYLSVYFSGYGFVDFDSPAAAQKAVASLKANGVQAQMAKVRTTMLLQDYLSCWVKFPRVCFTPVFLKVLDCLFQCFFFVLWLQRLIHPMVCVLESCVSCDRFCSDIHSLPISL